MIALLLLLVSFSSASNLKLEYGVYRYELKFGEKEIKISGPGLFTKLNQKKCNKHIIDEFLEKMSLLTTGLPLRVGSSPEMVNYSLDGKKYFEVYGSLRSKFLVALPREVKRLKVEELLSCR